MTPKQRPILYFEKKWLEVQARDGWFHIMYYEEPPFIFITGCGTLGSRFFILALISTYYGAVDFRFRLMIPRGRGGFTSCIPAV
jgi:hypothetical protein